VTEKGSKPNTLLIWLTPGIGVKRWLFLLVGGAMVFGIGIAQVVLALARANPGASWPRILVLGGVPAFLRAALAGGIGVSLILFSLIRINKTILGSLDLRSKDVADAIFERRQRGRGPKVVAVGGGTGMPTLLRGLKQYTANLTAVVTVADDGGSSGRLRRELGVLPPGDFRNNIAALARDEGLMTQLFQYRFGEGGLEGHSFGNLFITALSGVTGSFERALVESSRVLAIRGQVLPSTLADVTLGADMREMAGNGTRRVTGESTIPKTIGTVDRVFLQPDDVPAYPDTVRAILDADLIVLGPGSLFTSILPNLLVRGIAEAIRRSPAVKVYVCNVATQRGETEGFSVADHVRAIERQIGPGLFDNILVNGEFPPLEPDANFTYVRLDNEDALSAENALSKESVRIHQAPLVDNRRPWRHDSDKLAKAITALLADTTDELSR
jgi:uncharacterized cofD-like protein